MRRTFAAFITLAMALGASAAAPGASDAAPARHAAAESTPIDGPVGPLGHVGRWLVDGTGRIVTLHGVNEVAKSKPFYPASVGFGDDDAAFLVQRGFSAVRLGVVWE